MIIALIISGYIGIALLCVYLAGRLSGAADAPLWLLWPVILPIFLVAFVFEAVGDLGERHGK